jgi:hypothetical protein
MTVVVLRLPGLPAEGARQAAGTLLDLSTGPPDLRRLLVLDDTALLDAHSPVYQRLITARRVDTLLCIAVGPRTPGVTGGKLMLPGNLGGTQGSPVLWVSDPDGVDWRAAASAIALGHAGGGGTPSSGLERVLDLLSVDAVFDAVHEALCARVPGRVASPGLWLTGADDEAATFAAALAIAITKITASDPPSRGAGGAPRGSPGGSSATGTGGEGPFPALAPAASGGASLAPGGPLARYRDEAAESVAAARAALGKLTGIGGAFRRGDGGASEHLIEAGTALADLRAQVDRLLREAHATGDLTVNQHRLVQAAGIRFPAGPSAVSLSVTPPASHEASPVFREVSAAVSGGDPLPAVSRRLTLTERDAKRRGSAAYLPEAERACPAALLEQLADPPRGLRPSPLGGAQAVRRSTRDLGLEEAARAATALTDLVIAVANREWSPSAASLGELARARVAIDGARKALLARAGLAARSRGASGARLARLADTLAPVLRDLVLRVVAAEISSPSAGGPEAFTSAHDRAAALLADWARLVAAEGVSARPSFTAAGAPGTSPEMGYLAVEDDIAEVREALLARPGQEMWQLCTPDDLSALDVASPPHVVRFAPRLARDSLAGTLPAEVAPVWTSAGSYAGLIRLVPLRSGVVCARWGEPHLAGPAAGPEPALWPTCWHSAG